MATLPPVLAGPLVRRVEPRAVHLWIATSRKFDARAEVLQLPASKADRILTLDHPPSRAKALRGTAAGRNVTTVQLGSGLFVTLLKAVPKDKPFPTDELLFYDIFLDDKPLWDPALGELFEHALDVPKLDRPREDSIVYPGAPLPSFVIASELHHLLHGSCHKLHGEGADAFAFADQRLRETAEDARERPALLFLTGDQIYADDVADDVIPRIAELAEMLLGVDERVPGLNRSLARLTPGERGRLVTSPQSAGFTSGEARNHLLGFGEFAALHILSWSPALWPGLPRPQRTVTNPFPGESGQAPLLRNARDASVRVRRALANVPAYMIFDDHDVTDDWNLDLRWRAHVEGSPLGRRVVANALAAYWAFQGWGNQPADFPARFLETLEKHLAGGARNATGGAYDDALWKHSQWSFATPTRPVALALDLRTQRGAAAQPGAASEPMDRKTGYQAATTALKSAGYRGNAPLLVVSSLPVLGAHVADQLQRQELRSRSAAEVDFEGWAQSRTGRPRLLRFLQKQVGRSYCVILSGDVHYAFAAHGWFSQGAEALAVLQLTSSALKNEAKEARNAEALSRGEAGRMAVQATRGVNIASTGVLEQGWEWGAQPPASPGLAALRNTLQQLQQRLAALPANDRARGDLQAEIQRTDIEVRRLEDVLAQRPVILDNLRDQDALAIAADPTWQLGYRYVPFRDRNFLESSANMGWVELQDELVIHRLAVSEGGTFQIETQRLDVSLSRALGVP